MLERWVRFFMLVGGVAVSAYSMVTASVSTAHTIFKLLETHRLAHASPAEGSWRDTCDDQMAYWMARYKEPSEWERRHLVYTVLHEASKEHLRPCKTVFEFEAGLRDLSLVSSAQGDFSLVSVCNRAVTSVGQETFAFLLTQPVDERSVLEARQAMMQELVTNNELYNQLRKLFKQLQHCEALVLSFWHEYDIFAASANHSDRTGLPWSLGAWCDQQPSVVMAKSVYNHHAEILLTVLSCAAAVLGPWYVVGSLFPEYAMPEALENTTQYMGMGAILSLYNALLHKMYGSVLGNSRGHIDTTTRLSNVAGGAVLGFLQVPEFVKLTWHHFVLHRYAQEKMIALAVYLKTLREIAHVVEECPILNIGLKHGAMWHAFFELYPTESSDLKKFLGLLETPTFHGQPSLLHHKGRTLVAYRLFDSVKEYLQDVIVAAGELDAYVSVAQLVREHACTKTPYCFVEYVWDQQNPQLVLEGVWHPMVAHQLSQGSVVSNDIALGGNCRRNLLITGPNEGGKSTILRAAGVAVIFAQTFGVAPAQTMKCTPFASIATYLTMEDDLAGGASLFRAEVIRAQQLVDRIKTAGPQGFCFTIIDELFRGTSPAEGQAAAYSVAKHVGKFSNSLSMVATHFTLLTDLAHTTHEFSNAKVSVTREADGRIIRHFKLEPGISYQHVALDVLESQGLTGDIVAQAQHILQQEAAAKEQPPSP